MDEEVADLIKRYRELAAVRSGADYGSPASVRSNNAADDEMRAIAARIGAAGRAAVDEFGTLLADARDGLSLYAAFHLLELTRPPESLARAAFGVIEGRAAGDDLEALGCRMRLEELRENRREGAALSPPTCSNHTTQS